MTRITEKIRLELIEKLNHQAMIINELRELGKSQPISWDYTDEKLLDVFTLTLSTISALHVKESGRTSVCDGLISTNAPDFYSRDSYKCKPM